jgi:hypothetical protein
VMTSPAAKAVVLPTGRIVNHVARLPPKAARLQWASAREMPHAGEILHGSLLRTDAVPVGVVAV